MRWPKTKTKTIKFKHRCPILTCAFKLLVSFQSAIWNPVKLNSMLDGSKRMQCLLDMQAVQAHTVGMKTKQYTIRRVHPVIDKELRRMARASNRSLNEVTLNILQIGLGLHSYDLEQPPEQPPQRGSSVAIMNALRSVDFGPAAKQLRKSRKTFKQELRELRERALQ